MNILNWGLIGCGNIVQRRIAPALAELKNCKIAAVNRADYTKAKAFAKEFGAEKYYKTYEELIKDDEIEAVYIATPVNRHAEQTIKAAEHGKHVLCEKPMGIKTAECIKMIDACKSSNVKLGIAYYRHFYPVILRAKEIIKNCEIGKPVLCQINAFNWFNPAPSEPRYWLLQKEQSGGGPMMDFGCHRIEVLQNLFGRIIDISSVITTVLENREVEDTGTAVFKFSENTLGVINVSNAIFCEMDTLDIFGTKGSIHIPVLNKGLIIIKIESGERTESLPPHKNIHLPLINNFTESVLNGLEPKVGGEAGLEVQKVLDKIYKY